MVQELTFTKNERNRWESSFVSTGSPSAVYEEGNGVQDIWEME